MNISYRSVSARKSKYHVGMKYGRLTVIKCVGKHPKKNGRMWLCECDCGNEHVVMTSLLTTGTTTSCGCVRATNAIIHGQSRSPTYSSWRGMIRRCFDKKHHAWENYGGRGITVCSSWVQSFSAFVSDMGNRPTRSHEIDRIDNDGNYQPGNCRWATIITQANNRRGNRIVTGYGKSMTIAQWSRHTGIGYHVIRQRLVSGWTPGDSVSVPMGSINNYRRQIQRESLREAEDGR